MASEIAGNVFWWYVHFECLPIYALLTSLSRLRYDAEILDYGVIGSLPSMLLMFLVLSRGERFGVS